MRKAILAALGLTLLLGAMNARADTSGLIAESTPVGGNYYESPWLGLFYTNGGDWLFSVQVGWLYCADSSDTSALWFYSLELGWIFTGNGTYPSIYVNGSRAWVYYFKSDGTRYYYNFSGDYYAAIGDLFSNPTVVGESDLVEKFHGVQGQVQVLSNGVITITGFNFDGGGIDVRAILSTNSNFADYTILSGTLNGGGAYNGANMTFLMPDYLAGEQRLYISIWCLPVSISFGDAVLLLN